MLSPILGTIADFSRAKKQLLAVFTALSVVFTGLLFSVQAGDVLMAILFFILAETGYRAAQVFYDALLVDVSTPEDIGRVSGNGWAMGMLGGILCLIIVLIPIQVIKGELMGAPSFSHHSPLLPCLLHPHLLAGPAGQRTRAASSQCLSYPHGVQPPR